MNKLFLVFGVLVLVGLAIGTAVLLEHYGVFQTTINVQQPITVSGELEQTIDCNSGDTCLGQEITISNADNQDRWVTLTTTEIEGITTLYGVGGDSWHYVNGTVQILALSNVVITPEYTLDLMLEGGEYTLITTID